MNMKSNLPKDEGEGETKGPLPKPNAKMKMSASGMSFTKEEVRGLIANPVYAVSAPFHN